jgi:hypothetical protein
MVSEQGFQIYDYALLKRLRFCKSAGRTSAATGLPCLVITTGVPISTCRMQNVAFASAIDMRFSIISLHF